MGVSNGGIADVVNNTWKHTMHSVTCTVTFGWCLQEKAIVCIMEPCKYAEHGNFARWELNICPATKLVYKTPHDQSPHDKNVAMCMQDKREKVMYCKWVISNIINWASIENHMPNRGRIESSGNQYVELSRYVLHTCTDVAGLDEVKGSSCVQQSSQC